ncbi:kinesin-like protein KIN-14C [Arachis hypogaea]|uniref:kinesin-like protein KIN-14C n=1 Tax=Arachis hypogaea TaxID=3818 RepID=UPI0010FC62CA|nr:kinesin-like protein KIN-14C [Arachis hypogaea]
MNNSTSENHNTESKEMGSPKPISTGICKNGFIVSIHGEVEAKHRLLLVQWISTLLPSLNLPINITDDVLRACLRDGIVLCQILNKLRPGSVPVVSEFDHEENLKSFLKAMDALGLPQFSISDLEKGSMKVVVDCLLSLRAKSLQNVFWDNNSSTTNSKVGSPHGITAPSVPFPPSSETTTKHHRSLSSPFLTESPTSLLHQGHKFHEGYEVFQGKEESYADLSPTKISEMVKSVSLDNAPTQSLLGVVNGILEETVEKRNGEMPYRVACLLRKVSQELERRMSAQAEHSRTQSNLFKVREEKYQSRIRALEALAVGNNIEEDEIIASQLHLRKAEKFAVEENKPDDRDFERSMKKQEDKILEISALTEDLETSKKALELKCSRLEVEAMEAKAEIEQKTKAYEQQLEEWRNKCKELESSYVSKYNEWNMKKNQMLNVVTFQSSKLEIMKLSWESIKQDVMQEQKVYAEECNQLGVNLKSLAHAAENYQVVVAENRKLFNEIQELKGNIRVYCRIKPFTAGAKEKQSIIEHIGEDNLVVANPSKQGKDALRSFKFNKVFGPDATQADVYADIQALTRSVLDGYNVCIFAYGQTGSGKTYTMTGPTGATSENLGVNYRALNDLFRLSTSRTSSIEYEIGVQMVEIYNEQVRDLLLNVGILTHSQPEGLAVPDASMFHVNAPSDVIKLMDIGLKNRAISATAMNERSSRSHSVVTIHVRGKDLNSGSTLVGNLHLVDLAGSERVDRSEVTGDRLREAQHINKSLSAFGDVIFALSQKSSHVPYRNSKLTQLLQASLGGHAKTLMFIQINSDVNSYSETMSTLKFAERVSGIELGAARSNKESKDVKELMEQVASLKNSVSKKDEEIERLQLLHFKQLQRPSTSRSPRDESLRRTKSSIGGDKTPRESWSYTDADFDERSNNNSDYGYGSESSKSSDKMDKPKTLQRSVQSMKKASVRVPSPTKTQRDPPKMSPAPGIRKSASIGHLRQPGSKRWQ